jgi:uncharacterized membrane protein
MSESLDDAILNILETEQPKNVKELVHFVQEHVSASPDDIAKEVKNLQKKGFISILLIPGVGTPLSILRYVFGFILASFLPGYCLTEVLFPRKSAMDEIERFTFSVGLSFAVTALVGLFLSFTPFGLTFTTALVTLGFFIIVLALIAYMRKSKAGE